MIKQKKKKSDNIIDKNIVTLMMDGEFESDNISIAGSSIIGTRHYQQDYILSGAESGSIIAVLCDGMGGLNGGEVASKHAAEMLMNDFKEWKPVENIPNFLRYEAKKLDNEVLSLKDENGNFLYAGTTIVAIIISNDILHWLSVGDSKIYIMRNDEILCVTREHNYKMTLDELLENGKISREQYKKEEPRAEALISFLGMGNIIHMDINTSPFKLISGDKILLCSDGLYKSLSEHQIFEIIKSNTESIEQTAHLLTSYAFDMSEGSQDNTSVILVEYGGNK